MARAFIIRPFGKQKDSSGKEIDFEGVHEKLIEPALVEADLGGGTTGEIIDSGNIREDMFSLILEADLVICDITIHNANVFYELGIRHALRKKRTVLIKAGTSSDQTPFDLLTDRYLKYNIDDPADTKNNLVATIKAAMVSDRKTDSPIFQMLPGLPEADPSTVRVVPSDFGEEVARACAAKAAGWLRLLATEVADRRFQWEGLRTVATAQWELKDFEGACKSWERIRDNDPHDIAANLALANIYERLYRENKDPVLLEHSDQAIARVKEDSRATLKQLAEALALEGRNRKTLWRLEFEDLEEIEQRRTKAMNRALRGAYESYGAAFLVDLNHFWSGLAALQMGTILLDLSETDAWKDAFDDDDEADNYRKKLNRRVEALRFIIPESVDASLDRLEPTDPDRVWAEISAADVLFLTETRPNRVIQAYKNAIPTKMPFAWDAAKGQLALFAKLGIKADLVGQIIEVIDPRFKKDQAGEAEQPLHVILFAGHRVDEERRSRPRFPAECEARARELIRDSLVSLIDDGHEIYTLASAAAGSDILFHEVCVELGIENTICLPMPKAAFAKAAFKNLDSWRSRFLDLVEREKQEVIELSDREGLPRWLHEAALDSWERGNRWVLEMGLTRNAAKTTMLALWDGKQIGDAPGGTAQAVQLARDTGIVRVEVIQASKLRT